MHPGPLRGDIPSMSHVVIGFSVMVGVMVTIPILLAWIGGRRKLRVGPVGGVVTLRMPRGHNAILMEYIGDELTAAPTLNTVPLESRAAGALFERLLHNLRLMLARAIVHGDLSAYNILYWEGEIWLIDFPQAINPDENHNAYRIFERDITRICEYFARQGVACTPRRLAAELWTSSGRRLGPDVHPRLLDDGDEADIAYWRSQEEAER